MTSSPLLEHLGAAETIDLAGWRIAAHYGDPAAEVAAVHRAAGLIDRGERGRIAVLGEARCDWLNKIVSNDTSRLAPGDGLRALLLTVKGRIGCDLRVYALADRLLLDTAFDTAEGLLENLRRFRLYGDAIELRDLRPETCQLGLHGPAAARLASEVSGLDAASIERYGCIESDGLLLVRHDEFGEPGYDLIAPVDRGPALWATLSAEAQPFGWLAAEIMRVEAGEPRWGAELNGDHFPLEAELEEALSHTKGCYPGQEVVARMRDRGHPNKLLRPLAVAGDKVPVRGAHVLARDEPKPVGTIYSAVASPTLGVRALAYLKTECAEPGTTLFAVVDGPPAKATVLARPAR